MPQFSRTTFATQILNFFQASRWVISIASLLALLCTLCLFPFWLQAFTSSNVAVEAKISALGVEYVRAYWDDPQQHPEAYERIAINPKASQRWNIKIETLREKNSRSRWSQVVVLDIRTPQEQINWFEVQRSAEWKISPHWEPQSVPQGQVANTAVAGESLSAVVQGNPLRIKLLRGSAAGKVRITVNNESQVIDLYSPAYETEPLSFLGVKPGKAKVHQYQFNIVATPWRQLQFVAEGEGAVTVQELKVKGQMIRPIAQTNAASNVTLANPRYRLPFQFWNRSTCAIFASLMSWLWLTTLSISTIHLWNRQGHKRFGSTTYAFTLATSLGGLWTIIFFPAVMTLDTINQWQQALTSQYHNWYPPITAMLMHLTLGIAESPSIYSVLQGSLFWFSIFYLLRQILRRDRAFLLSASLFVFLPSLWLYSIAIVTNAGTAIFALFASAFFIRAIREQRQWLFIAALSFLAIAVCFRHDAVFLFFVPVILSQITFDRKAKLAKRLVHILLMMAIVIAPCKLIERLPGVNNTGAPTSYVFVNQYVGTLTNAKLSANEMRMERRSINRRFGAGTLQGFLKRYQCDVSDYTWRNSKTAKPFYENNPKNEAFVFMKVIQTAFRYPIAFMQHRLCNLSFLLQIPSTSYFFAIPYDTSVHDEQLRQGDIQGTTQFPDTRKAVLDTIVSLTENPWTAWLFRHYLYIILVGISLTLFVVHGNIELLVISLIGTFSFIGYWLPDGFPDWRHLLLAYLCSWIGLVALIDFVQIRLTQKKGSTPD